MLTYEEIINNYLKDDPKAMFLFACLDFGYYMKLISSSEPIEDAKIVWDHIYDIVNYLSLVKKYDLAIKMKESMDLMLKEQNEQALKSCISIVFPEIANNVDLNSSKSYVISKNMKESIIEFENSIGINGEKYQLLRSVKDLSGKNVIKFNNKISKNIFYFVIAIIATMILCLILNFVL